MKRTLLICFILSFFVSLSNGQNSYILGRYEINPAKKTVSVLTGFITSFGDGGHAHGERFVPDSTINYDNTTLFVIGNQFIFKEHIPQNWSFPSQLDFNTLRIIRIDLEKHNGSLCRDKNFLYRNSIGIEQQNKWEAISLVGYEIVNDFVYKKDNDLYFLTKDFKLKKNEDVTLDISTLTHIMGNYFADKNGLYLLGGYETMDHRGEYTETGLVIWRKEWADSFYDKSVQLEKSKGKTITPIIKRDYFVYGNNVYSPVHINSHKPLPLNIEKMKELEIRHSSYANYRTDFLADDKHTFVTMENGGYVSFETRYNNRYTNHWFVNNDFFEKDVNQWQVISKRVFKEDEKTLCFPSEINQGKGKEYAGILIKKQNKFYTFEAIEKGTLQQFNRVLIFNFDTQEYEELDVNQYRYIDKDLWIYKNRLYVLDRGYPVKEDVDTENLRFITHHNIKTNYLTNDKSLIYMGNMGGYRTLGEGGNRMQVLGKRIVSEVDFSTLKVVTADILTDKENIYIGGREGISVIPIEALGLDVKIFTE